VLEVTVRITFRGSPVDENQDQPGKYRQEIFPDLTRALEWISLHIPEADRLIIKMWIDDIPITGAKLEAVMLRSASDHR
jgi:hypothetical protein